MEKSAYASTQVCVFEPAKLRDYLARKLPFATAKQAARLLNTSSRNVENWLALKSAPSCSHYAAMVALWGLDFLAETMTRPPDWIDGARRAEQAAAIEADLARLERARADLKALA